MDVSMRSAERRIFYLNPAESLQGFSAVSGSTRLPFALIYVAVVLAVCMRQLLPLTVEREA